MATVSVPNSLTNGTTALGSEVKANDDALVTFLNANVVHTDGSKAMTGQLTLPSGTPALTEAVRRDYLESYVAGVSARNAIQNGDLSSWTSGPGPFTAVPSSANWTADNFSAYLGGGSTSTTTRENQALSAFSGEGRFFRRTVVTTGNTSSSYANINYGIQDVRTLAGKTVTVSFWARATAASKFMSVEFTQGFGTGGTPSAEVNSIGPQKIALSTSWQRYSVTAALPSVSGKTLGTNNDSRLDINLWLDAGSNFNGRTASLGSQSITFEDWGWQLEEGSSASAFSPSPVPVFMNEAGGRTPGPWQAYTPTWTAVTTNPTLGNGSIGGRWRYTGPKTVDLHITLTMGSTTTYGAGPWRFSIPTGTVLSSAVPIQLGTWVTGTGSTTPGNALFYGSGTFCELMYAGGYVTATGPHAWANGNQLHITMRGLELT